MRQNQVEKKQKVLPSDNNSPNRTTTQERQNQVKKKGKFCLQITTAQIGRLLKRDRTR